MMAIFSSKALLLSCTALCTAFVFGYSDPVLRDLVTSVLPQIWCSVLSWLAPPYLYFVINAIIISIAASSGFRLQDSGSKNNPPEIRPDLEDSDLDPAAEEEEEALVSAGLGQRQSARASPQGGSRASRVAKPKRHETLERTWKTITEDRSVTLARHLKKSDTWDSHVRDDGQHPVPVVEKSRTMNDRITSASPSPGRKESSLSQDELTRRVEAFIKKFNEEMRLQRQESLQNYMEMSTSVFEPDGSQPSFGKRRPNYTSFVKILFVTVVS